MDKEKNKDGVNQNRNVRRVAPVEAGKHEASPPVPQGGATYAAGRAGQKPSSRFDTSDSAKRPAIS
jgi:hypothetical protein